MNPAEQVLEASHTGSEGVSTCWITPSFITTILVPQCHSLSLVMCYIDDGVVPSL